MNDTTLPKMYEQASVASLLENLSENDIVISIENHLQGSSSTASLPIATLEKFDQLIHAVFGFNHQFIVCSEDFYDKQFKNKLPIVFYFADKKKQIQIDLSSILLLSTKATTELTKKMGNNKLRFINFRNDGLFFDIRTRKITALARPVQKMFFI
jgi:hypothetical protein